MKFIHNTNEDLFKTGFGSEKTIIGALVVFVIVCLVIVLLPTPVHKPNKCCSADACAIQHHHEKIARVYTDEQLQAWYDGFNEEYFSNRLQKAEVKWDDLTAKNDMGLTERRPDGSILITLDRATNNTRKTAQWTVAHETCHVAVPAGLEFEDHGPKFQNCMVNLATHGAFADIW